MSEGWSRPARADREAIEARLRESATEMERERQENAAAMESGIGDPIDPMGGRIERMDARILATVRHGEGLDNSRIEGLRTTLPLP